METPRYRLVLESLQRDIRRGKYPPGAKLPSEAALVKQFQTSRITVGRALRELKQSGLLRGVAGSGTFVQDTKPVMTGLLFGLLIPDLGETEIFEPICQGLASAPQTVEHGLLWGNTGAPGSLRDRQALNLCRQFIERRVDGVFFAPLEFTPEKDQTNLEIVELLDRAAIPVVLLDRDVLPFPQRSRHDLVGIDNRRAGYLATLHLLEQGSQRIACVSSSPTGTNAAPTVVARIAGYREALLDHGRPITPSLVQVVESVTPEAVSWFLGHSRPDAIVCANDRLAADWMRRLLDLGRRIPGDIRIVGIDDVEYAGLLPVPLTTVRQPCREIGEAALWTMLERIQRPAAVARDVYLDCALVVRQSG